LAAFLKSGFLGRFYLERFFYRLSLERLSEPKIHLMDAQGGVLNPLLSPFASPFAPLSFPPSQRFVSILLLYNETATAPFIDAAF